MTATSDATTGKHAQRPILVQLYGSGALAVDPESGRARDAKLANPFQPRWNRTGGLVAWVYWPEGEGKVPLSTLWTAEYRWRAGRFSQPRGVPVRLNRPTSTTTPMRRDWSLWETPAWAPDGKWLLVGADDLSAVHVRTGRERILLPSRVLPRGAFHGCDWSADDRIVYSVRGRTPVPQGAYDPEEPTGSDPGFRSDVYVASLRTQRSWRMGTGSRPRFSPTGRWVLVVDRRSDRFGLGLKLYDLATAGNPARWLEREALAGCFTPSGRSVLCLVETGALWEVNLDGKRLRRVSSRRDLENAVQHTLPDPIRRGDVDW